MYLLTYFPPLWFKVMDKRLLDAVGRDPSRINFLPAKREMLMRRYGLVDAAAPEGAEVAA
jgi:alkane 1-monooxygenase